MDCILSSIAYNHASIQDTETQKYYSAQYCFQLTKIMTNTNSIKWEADPALLLHPEGIPYYGVR